MKDIINIIQSEKYNFIKLNKVIYAIINDIIKDDYFEDNYNIFLTIFNYNNTNKIREYLNKYIYYQFQLYINENIAFNQNDKIEIFKNISYVMIDLLGFINNDIKEYFFEKSMYYDNHNYEIIKNPYYNKKFIKYVNKYQRYINYIFKNKLYKSKANKKITYGGSKIHNLLEKEIELFNYFDNMHDFSKFSHINIDYKYYNLPEEDIKDIKKSKIEDSFINKLNRNYFYEINIQNSNNILNYIYNIIDKYKIVNDAYGFSAIFSKVGYISHKYYEYIIKRIEERKYSINTLANLLDSGNPLKSHIIELNNHNHNYKNINDVLSIINVYNYFLEEIFYNKNIHLFPKIDLTIKDIVMKVFIKDNKNGGKISENKGYIKKLDLYKGFNSIENIVGKLEVLEQFNINEKYINEKYFFLRLKSMGDRIQAYEVYYTNKKLLTPIIVLKNKKFKKYKSNKKLLLATNDKMLTYFSMNGFDKMNILSIYKNNIILQNDFH